MTMRGTENCGAGPIVERHPAAPDESLPRMPEHHQIPTLMIADPGCGCGRPMDTMDITDALTTHTKDGCNGNRFCAIKYILRAGRKPNTPYEKDMRKAFWCVVRELQRLGMNPQAMLNEAAIMVADRLGIHGAL